MVDISASDSLNWFRKIRKEEVLWKRKDSRQKFEKVNFFEIPKSSDMKISGKCLRKVS